VAPLKNMEEVFVLHPVAEQKPLSVFLNFSSFAWNPSRKDEVVKQTKKWGFEKLGESGFLGKSGIPGPP
jgi:hypothetical protein